MDNQQYKKLYKTALVRALQKVGVSNPRTVFLGDPTQPDTPVIVPPERRLLEGMVYVYSVADGSINVEQALNDGGLIAFDDSDHHLPVLVGYPNGSRLLKIVGLPPEAYQTSGGASPQQVALKAGRMITANRFQELRLVSQVTPDLTLQLRGGFWIDNTQVRNVADNALFADLTSHVPSTIGEARYVHVAVDATGAAAYTDGTAFELVNEVNETDHYPAQFGTGYSLGYVKLINGQTQITEDDLRFPLGLYSGTGIVPLTLGGAGRDVTADEGVMFYTGGSTYPLLWVGDMIAPPTVNDDTLDGYRVLSVWATSVSAGAAEDAVYLCIDPSAGAAVWVRLDDSGVNAHSTANVSNPPTDAELDTAFGTPASVGAGFIASLNDNGAGTTMYLIASDGASWFYTSMTQAV